MMRRREFISLLGSAAVVVKSEPDMHDVRSLIQDHYGSNDLIQGMMAALTRAGHDTASPTMEMLNLVDQLHMGGLNSTKDQAELVGITRRKGREIPSRISSL